MSAKLIVDRREALYEHEVDTHTCFIDREPSRIVQLGIRRVAADNHTPEQLQIEISIRTIGNKRDRTTSASFVLKGSDDIDDFRNAVMLA